VTVAVAAVIALAGAGAALFLVRGGRAAPRPPIVVAVEAPSTATAQPGAVSGPAAKGRTGEIRWSGTEPFRCDGNDNVVLRDCASVSNTPAGNAVIAKGNCKVTLISCKIRGNPAIEVQDNAEVTMQGGELVSPPDFAAYTVRMNQNAKLAIDGATVVGAEQAIRLDGSAVLRLKNTAIRRTDNVREARAPWACALELRDDAEAIIEGGSIDWVGQAVSLLGSSILVARGTSITSDRAPSSPREPSAVSLTGAAVAVLIQGKLKGPRIAAVANDVASLTLENVQVSGEVKSEGNATLRNSKDTQNAETSLAQLQAAARNGRAELKSEHDKISRYSRIACDGVFGCYSDNFPGGAVAGTVTMRVNAEGKVQSTVLLGNIPPKVAQCIRGLAKDRSIQDFVGPKGDLVCEYSGTIMKGTQMLSIKSDYRKVP
jgi:hypothetical protein